MGTTNKTSYLIVPNSKYAKISTHTVYRILGNFGILEMLVCLVGEENSQKN